MSMKIAELSVENYKRITGALASFDTSKPGVVEIGGRNEQGKSSFLDALEVAIAGRKGPKAVKPVHSGADRARIIATFEEEDGTKIVVTREFREGGDTSIVVKQDGLKVGKTTELLDKLWSHVAFDPFAWASLASKAQVETLVRVTGVDPAPFEARRKAAFERRTDVNREAARLAGVLEQMPDPDDTLAAAELEDVPSIAAEIGQVERRNLDRRQAASDAQRAEEEVRSLVQRLAAARQVQVDARALVVTLGEEEDTEDLTTRMLAADDRNDAIRQQRERARVEKERAELLDRANLLTSQISDADADKRQAFADADMPVPGLTIEEEEVYLNGTPFSQTSPGGKLKTSIAIAMALNPDLRVIVVRDGALLDAENRRIVGELAEANDFLVLMEVVDEAAPSGIVFEDGKIREGSAA